MAYQIYIRGGTTTTTTKPPVFAVEAPDGTSEALQAAEKRQVDDLIEHAALYEDRAFVQELHAQQDAAARIFAVDAPSGESDAMLKSDEEAVENVIDYAAEHEDKEQIEKMHQLDEAVRQAMNKRAGLPDYGTKYTQS